MAVPNAENLRAEYNEHYRQPHDRWSCHQLEEAQRMVAQILEKLSALAPVPRENATVLDVGCAKGHIAEAFRVAGFEAHGLDYSDVAIEISRNLFPKVTFHHMDGFNPGFDRKFSLIFIRGFSGCNTLDMPAIATCMAKYVALLQNNGVLILGYPTDFSGRHRRGDTACWSHEQIARLVSLVPATHLGEFITPKPNPIRWIKIFINRLLGRRPKFYLYLYFIRRNGPGPTAD